MLDKLLGEANLAPTGVDVVGFGCGPGSFTGVRIAAAATQAVALAADAQVVPIPSSAGLVRSARDLSSKKLWLCAVPSRGQAYYLSSYKMTEQAVVNVIEDQLVDEAPTWVNELDPQICGLIGGLPQWMEARWQPSWVAGVVPRADRQLDWVIDQYEIGGSVAPELAWPTYVPGDSPWKKSIPKVAPA